MYSKYGAIANCHKMSLFTYHNQKTGMVFVQWFNDMTSNINLRHRTIFEFFSVK